MISRRSLVGNPDRVLEPLSGRITVHQRFSGARHSPDTHQVTCQGQRDVGEPPAPDDDRRQTADKDEENFADGGHREIHSRNTPAVQGKGVGDACLPLCSPIAVDPLPSNSRGPTCCCWRSLKSSNNRAAETSPTTKIRKSIPHTLIKSKYNSSNIPLLYGINGRASVFYALASTIMSSATTPSKIHKRAYQVRILLLLYPISLSLYRSTLLLYPRTFL